MSHKQLLDARLRAYSALLVSDVQPDVAVQDVTRLWADMQAIVQQCCTTLASLPLTDSAHTPSAAFQHRAELLLTLLVCQQVGIRDFALLDQTIDQVYDLLPELRDPRLRLHILVHLYAETGDETLLPEIDTLRQTFIPKDVEDKYLLQVYHDINTYVNG